jgi:hypothetical protein
MNSCGRYSRWYSPIGVHEGDGAGADRRGLITDRQRAVTKRLERPVTKSEGTERKKVVAGALGWRRIRLDIRISASRCHAEKCAISARLLFGNAAIAPSLPRSVRSVKERLPATDVW